MMVGWKPVCEIQHDAGEEARLRNTEEKADDAKAGCPGNSRGEAGEDTPTNHDPGDPDTRTDLFHNHVAGHLEDEISPIEGAKGKTVFRGRDAKVAAHRQCREA